MMFYALHKRWIIIIKCKSCQYSQDISARGYTHTTVGISMSSCILIIRNFFFFKTFYNFIGIFHRRNDGKISFSNIFAEPHENSFYTTKCMNLQPNINRRSIDNNILFRMNFTINQMFSIKNSRKTITTIFCVCDMHTTTAPKSS